MKNVTTNITLIFFISCSMLLTYPQTDSTDLQIEEVIDDILVEESEEGDNSANYELIEEFITNPLNLNEAEFSELTRIPYLDFKAAEMIINHREKYGKFFTLDELNSVEGLPSSVVRQIKPFLKVDYVSPAEAQEEKYSLLELVERNKRIAFRSRGQSDLQLRKGFESGAYAGSKSKMYNRLISKYGKYFQVGILAEKDPGEKSASDFSSFHIALEEMGFIKRLILGDYILEFGQGLVIWSPYGFSKGADAVYPAKKHDRKIKPYTSSDENNFLRGISALLQYNNLNLSLFYSRNKLDANIDSLSGRIASTPSDGYHRTPSEISRKKSVSEKIIGAAADYTFMGKQNVGVLFYNSLFSNEFAAQSINDISGNNFDFYSLYFDFYWKNLNFFGEIAYDKKTLAQVIGLQTAVSKDITWITLLRNYPKNFYNIHSNSFSESSTPGINEWGIYNGLYWRSSFALINFYFDMFKFPSFTFLNPVPSLGNEFLIDIVTKPIKDSEVRIRYKYESKEITKEAEPFKKIVEREKLNFRFEWIQSLSKIIRLKGRFEYTKYNIDEMNTTEAGQLIFQDIRYSPIDNLSLYGRIIVFKTDSFNSAIYEYENDLNGILTNLAMYGEGVRWYLIAKYRFFRGLTLSLKYSETYKPNEKSLSSGNSEIKGSLDNEIGIQLDLSL